MAAFTNTELHASIIILFFCERASSDAISRYYRLIPQSPQLPPTCNFSVTGDLIVSVNPAPPICCPDVEKCIAFAVASLWQNDPAVCDQTCQQIHTFLTLLQRTNKLQIASLALSFVATLLWSIIVTLYECYSFKDRTGGIILIVTWVLLELGCLACQSTDNSISWGPGYLDTAVLLQNLECHDKDEPL